MWANDENISHCILVFVRNIITVKINWNDLELNAMGIMRSKLLTGKNLFICLKVYQNHLLLVTHNNVCIYKEQGCY